MLKFVEQISLLWYDIVDSKDKFLLKASLSFMWKFAPSKISRYMVEHAKNKSSRGVSVSKVDLVRVGPDSVGIL